MKTLFLAAAVVLSLGVGSAYADGGVPATSTMFTQLPGVLSSAPHGPAAAPTQDGRGMQDYATHASPGTWLFAPNPNGGGAND